jgi:hypothetical protein
MCYIVETRLKQAKDNLCLHVFVKNTPEILHLVICDLPQTSCDDISGTR